MADPIEQQLARRAAAAAAQRPGFLAGTLVRFQQAEGLDEAGLAGWLGIEPDRLPWLALCRLPRPAAFAADVATIADRLAIAPERLAALIRRAEALAALETYAAGQEAGLLAAAREHEEPYAAEPPEEES